MLEQVKKLRSKIIRDLSRKTQKQLSVEIGITEMTLSRIVRGVSPGRINTWEVVSKYYGLKKRFKRPSKS